MRRFRRQKLYIPYVQLLHRICGILQLFSLSLVKLGEHVTAKLPRPYCRYRSVILCALPGMLFTELPVVTRYGLHNLVADLL